MVVQRAAGFASRWGPVRLAALGLLLVFFVLLLAPAADAHGRDTVDVYRTDNLVRWGISRGITATSQSTLDWGTANGDLCSYWANPSAGAVSTPLTGCLNQDDATEWRFRAWSMLSGTFTDTTTAFAIAYKNASLVNQTGFNITWASEVPVDTLNWHLWYGGGPASTGTIRSWVTMRNLTGDVQLVREGPSWSCQTGSLGGGVFWSFSKVWVSSIAWAFDTSACSATGNRDWSWSSLDVFSSGTPAEVAGYHDDALDYADYLIGGASSFQQGNSNAGKINATGITNFTLTLKPGVNYVYSAGSCDAATQCMNAFGWDLIWPAPWTTGGSTTCIGERRWLGPAADNVNKVVHAWRITNTCGSNINVKWHGFLATNERNTLFPNHNLLHARTVGSTVTERLDATQTTPMGSFCWLCTNALSGDGPSGRGSFATLALNYGDRLGPLKTRPHSVVWDSANWDRNNVVVTQFGNAANPFQVDVQLNSREYYGNAVYLALALPVGLSGTACTAETQALVNGNAVAPVLKNIIITAAEGIMNLCVWPLDDLTRRDNIPLSAALDNQFLNPNRNHGTLYSVNIVGWHADALGLPVYGVGAVGGNKSLYFACRAAATAVPEQFCHANADTSELILPGLVSDNTLTFTVRDATSLIPGGAFADYPALPDVRVSETSTGAVAVTDAGGNASVSVSTSEPRVQFTRAGYVTYWINFTALDGPVHVNVLLTRNQSSAVIRSEVCVFGTNSTGGSQINCTVAPSNTGLGGGGSGQCDLFSAANLLCQTSTVPPGFKEYRFPCVRDRSVSGAFVGEVSISSASGFGFVTGAPVTGGGCVELRTQALQGSSHTFRVWKEGYRQLNFTAAWLDAPIVNITFHLERGEGFSTAQTVQAFNITESGQRTMLVVNVHDTTSRPIAGLPKFEDSLRSLGATLNIGGTMWGLLLFIILWVGFVGAWYEVVPEGLRRSAPPGPVLGGAALVAFFLVALLGLWPEWLLVVLGAAVLLIAALVIGRQVASPKQDSGDL